VFLEAGDETSISVMIEKFALRVWDETREDWSLVAGNYTFMVGFSAGDIILQQSVYIL
jgi:hypothetical protein